MPYNILFLPLIAGYYFVWHFRPLHIQVKDQTSYHVLFLSAIYGFGILLFSIIFLFLIGNIPYCGCQLISGDDAKEWGKIYEINGFGISIFALILGIISPHLLNRLPLFSKEKITISEVKKSDNALETMMYEALKKKKPVLIILNSDKCYVGRVIKTPDIFSEDKYLRLIPVLSGYRDKDKKELQFVHNYAELLKYSQPVFETDITLPVKEIESLRFFDIDWYTKTQLKSNVDEYVYTADLSEQPPKQDYNMKLFVQETTNYGSSSKKDRFKVSIYLEAIDEEKLGETHTIIQELISDLEGSYLSRRFMIILKNLFSGLKIQKRFSNTDLKMNKALSVIINSLNDVQNAVIKIGSLLVIKTTSSKGKIKSEIFARNLKQDDLKILNAEPKLLKNSRKLFDKLEEQSKEKTT